MGTTSSRKAVQLRIDLILIPNRRAIRRIVGRAAFFAAVALLALTINIGIALGSKPAGSPAGSYFWALALSPDGKTVASGQSDGTVQLWDMTAGTALRTLSGNTSGVVDLAFSSDGKSLVSAAKDATIKLWDVTSGKELQTLKLPGGWQCIAFSSDLKMLARAVHFSGRYRDFQGQPDVTTGEAVELWDLSTAAKLRTIGVEYEEDGYIKVDRPSMHLHVLSELTAIAFSPNGKTLAVGLDSHSKGSTVGIWEVATGKELGRLGLDGWNLIGHFTQLNFSGDGKALAAASEWGLVYVWDLSTGAFRRRLKEHDSHCWTAAFSPDGKMVASGSGDGAFDPTIILWDASSGSEIRRLKGHGNQLTFVIFSPDGKVLISESSDAIKIWEMPGGRLVRTLGRDSGLIVQ